MYDNDFLSIFLSTCFEIKLTILFDATNYVINFVNTI